MYWQIARRSIIAADLEPESGRFHASVGNRILGLSEKPYNNLAAEIRGHMGAAQIAGAVNAVAATVLRVVEGLVSPPQGVLHVLADPVLGYAPGDGHV